MNKISTPLNQITRVEGTVSKHIPTPRRVTIERLRQFARAYTSIPAAGMMTGIVLN